MRSVYITENYTMNFEIHIACLFYFIFFTYEHLYRTIYYFFRLWMIRNTGSSFSLKHELKLMACRIDLLCNQLIHKKKRNEI